MSRATLIRHRRETATEPLAAKRAVLYLRVSTPGQVNTDYNPEGISIPAQREAVQRKAAELGAEVVGEYVEPGRTATSIDKRPVFQEMMARIKHQRDVDYIIVYHFNRIFRNTIDSALVKNDLRKLEVRIVSTVMDLGDTLESQLVENIVGAVDEYRVKSDAADISYKMGQKAKAGGTISRTKLGYRNVREMVDGHEIRTVAVDPERAPFIQRGFELYATGQHTANEVLAKLTAAGLVTRGDRRTAPKPLSLNQFHEILGDRYYLGIIEHHGEEYPGRHEALVTADVFDRVQRVRELHGGGGTRQRTHHHYLKGLLWCGRCGKRLVITPGRGNGGTYFYFLCRGRQGKTCDQPFLRIEAVEAAVARHYATVALSEAFCARLRTQLDDAMLGELASLNGLKKRLGARLAELSAKEDQYLDLVGDPAWPKDKLRRKLDGIQAEREQIAAQLADTTGRLATGREFFLAALALLRDPKAFYEAGGTSVKRAMNKLIFTKLFVDGEEISGHELSTAVGDLMDAYRRVASLGPVDATTARNASSLALEDEAAWPRLTVTDLLAAIFSGHGSSRAVMVGNTGIEPVTSPV